MVFILIGLVILLGFFLYVGVPYIYGLGVRQLLKRRAIKSKALVLTFDDGPGSRLTPGILSLLAENNARATFFLLGSNIVGREHIVSQIAAQGHEICSHGYEHLHYWKVSPIRAIRDIKRGWRMIDASLSVKKEKYPFRPPYGKLNIFCLLYLWICQVPVVYWSVDLKDTRTPRPDPERIALLATKKGGAVSLAHDFDRADNSIDCFIIKSTQLILHMAKEKGMQTLTVSQLLC